MEFVAEMVKSNAFTRSGLAVAFCLLYWHFNGRTGRCDPSTETLAKETGLTERSVISAIAELRKSGWWRIGQGCGRGHTNSYLPLLEKVKHASPIGAGKGEAAFTLLPPETVKPSVRKGEARFTRTSKNQNHTVDLHRPVARSARARVYAPNGSQDGANREFEVFWHTYPSRRPHPNPMKPARLKFEAAVRNGTDPADIIRGAEIYRATIEGDGTDPRYIAQAGTWLNQERWNDYQDTPQPPRLRVGMN
jgi:hypothetical protein